MKTAFLAVALVASLSLPALAQGDVRVHVPLGIRSGFVMVEPGPQPGTKYVVVQNVVIPNTNGYATASWKLDDFSLVVGEKRYHPVARPGLGAVDIARSGVIGPHEALKGNLVFVVPDGVSKADLEFFPSQWYDGNFSPMKFCCLP
jgi:hypothetical protein